MCRRADRAGDISSGGSIATDLGRSTPRCSDRSEAAHQAPHPQTRGDDNAGSPARQAELSGVVERHVQNGKPGTSRPLLASASPAQSNRECSAIDRSDDSSANPIRRLVDLHGSTPSSTHEDKRNDAEHPNAPPPGSVGFAHPIIIASNEGDRHLHTHISGGVAATRPSRR